jgi:hypothetical protein
MQLWDKKNSRPVYTTCIQPFAPYKRRRRHIKVRCVTADDDLKAFLGFLLALAGTCGWIAFGIAFVRWWLV